MGEYILEGEEEGARLERQNAGALYSVAEELSGISFDHDKLLLDVGCGTGALTREILQRHPRININAVDFSEVRLKQARMYLRSEYIERVKFSYANILTGEGIPSSRFDSVVSRFVLHHLPDPFLAVKNMAAALKPEGRLVVIDSDGIMFNFHCSDMFVMDCLRRLEGGFEFDFMVGRKLRSYFIDAGLSNVTTRLIPMHFVGEDLALEISQYRERFALMMPYLEKVLGEKDARCFTAGYLAALEKGEGELFYNKFVCVGEKSHARENHPIRR